ncbi:N-acetylglucosamine kinase [Litoribacter ruber]|uniref:N-acetylglucosamine kinase n=1 Tax=Litoribacter ruber TaxID=702568 RepID=A0AAP2CKK6_9BACT|nr:MULTISPECIES: N-acetylglucosamine kinase [Litoribacter]MBS9525419.1 N-acetylglucosamine kinase [Litoribacter alkaliphilus]MBT0810506.1 N-acetylglucosamine kinase [Litoribacter ruber]
MLLIADSGSSKTNWKYINGNGEVLESIKTIGLNPYFLSQENITEIITEQLAPKIDSLRSVHFYGAGCGTPEKQEIVQQAIMNGLSVFDVEVKGDILGAARALFHDSEGIACVIGTGTNSCLYDGEEIIQTVPSLGYMLGDFGSGAVIGKEFLALLLQEKLPKVIEYSFKEDFGLTTPQILDKIYNKPLANRFLASFVPFLRKHAETPELRKMIKNGFSQFMDYYIRPYRNKSESTIGIVGSVGFYFQDFLLEVASDKGYKIRTIMADPMEGLIKYHCSHQYDPK